MEQSNPTVAYTLTRDEYLQFVRDCVQNEWAFHDFAVRLRRRYRNGFILFLFLWVCVTMFLMLPPTPGSSPPGAAFVFCFILLGLTIWSLVRLVRIRQATLRPLTTVLRRMTGSGELRYSNGEQRVTLLPEGVLVSDQNATWLVNWLFGIARVEETPGALLLFTSPSTAIVVPRRAFASESEADAYIARARSHFGERAQQTKLKVARYLEGRDAPCPRCNYNLRDGAGDRCPECGELLSIEAIVRAMAMRAPRV